MEAAAEAGLRAVAPEPRGYPPTDIPADGDYRVAAFAHDVISIADALNAETFSIVGHNWGALTAYAVANLAPGRVTRLITASVPHTGHFLLNIRLRQAYRSRYMAFFQLRGVAERRAAANDFAYLTALIREWSPTWTPDEDMIAAVKQAYSSPPRLRAALAYYRGLIPSIASHESRQLIFSPVTVPTRIMFGSDDECIGPELFQDQHRWFTHPIDLVRIDGAGHFIQWEKPDQFTENVLDFLQTSP
jgi:pimeloyl-ACP methyl ester carboxylesterase